MHSLTDHGSASHELPRAELWFRSLRDRICSTLEMLENEAPAALFPGSPKNFELRPGERKNGRGHGVGGFLQNGRLFEKACVHISTGHGDLTPEMTVTLPGGHRESSYSATSISLIVHPRSPRIPTVHMNTRYFATADYWFGGGADLSPMLHEHRRPDADDAIAFHAAMRQACDPYHLEWYDRYKAWCKEYFFLPHRNVERGVGGIFFDRHNSGDFERDFAFTRSVGEAFLAIYEKIVRSRMLEEWNVDHRKEQLAVRGLYVEFNLLYDRGTTFGLTAGGNTDDF